MWIKTVRHEAKQYLGINGLKKDKLKETQSSSAYEFILIVGGTSSWNTGPPTDHTTQNGYYMYIETSWPRKYGDRAWLYSRNFQATSGSSSKCIFRFFYHMYGNSVEQLNVYTRTFQNGSVSIANRVFTLKGNQGALWNRAVVTLTSSKNFQVYLFILSFPEGDFCPIFLFC